MNLPLRQHPATPAQAYPCTSRHATHRMRCLVVPPMDGWQFCVQPHTAFAQHLPSAAQQLVCMQQEQAAVPLHEETAILAVPAALVVEEAGLMGPLAVAACVMRPAVAPVRLAYLLCCC